MCRACKTIYQRERRAGGKSLGRVKAVPALIAAKVQAAPEQPRPVTGGKVKPVSKVDRLRQMRERAAS